MKRISAIILSLIMLISLAGCKGDDTPTEGTQPTPTPAPVKLPDVVTGHITVVDYGTMEFEIYPNFAPQSCLNFIYLAQQGYYNGTIINRVIKDGIVQMGKLKSGHEEIKTEFPYTIKGEFEQNGVKNDLSFMAGTMAWVLNGDDFDSASTEFGIYVKTETCASFKGSRAAFGIVTSGMDVIEKINAVETYYDEPTKEIMILEVVIDQVVMPGDTAPFVFPMPEFIKVQG